MSNRDYAGYHVHKGEAGTMGADHIEQQREMEQQRHWEEEQSRLHQEQQQRNLETQHQKNREEERRKKKGQQLQKKHPKQAQTKSKNMDSAFAGIALVAAALIGLASFSEPDLESSALWLGLIGGGAVYIGLHLLVVALKALTFVVKAALVTAGLVFIGALVAGFLGNL